MGFMRASLLPFLLVVLVSHCVASVEITTKSVPNGTVDTTYSAIIQASGGCTPYKWAVTSGKLPPGITGKASKSTTAFDLNGTPTSADSYSFSVSVTGCGGQASAESYKIVIQSAASHVVELQWDASTSSDIAGYNVYRQTEGTAWTKLNAGLIASMDYSDSTVADSTTYYYAATAVNTSGEESSKTPSIKVVIP
jgi:hypothetical protein